MHRAAEPGNLQKIWPGARRGARPCGQPVWGSLRSLCKWLGRLRAHVLGLSGRLLQLLRAAPLRVHFGFRGYHGTPLGPAHSPVAVFSAAAETPTNYQEKFPAALPLQDPQLGGEASPSPDGAPGPAPTVLWENAPELGHRVWTGVHSVRTGPGAGAGAREVAAVAGDCRRENRGTPFGTRSFTGSRSAERFSLILALIKVTFGCPRW